jgi:hypothetical protein
MEGYIGRLALNLHVIWEVASGKACPEEEIPLFIMEMAITLAKFYIGQVKLVHSFSDDEGLAPGIVKLFELSKRLDTNGKDGWVKAQQYRELFAAKKRPCAQQARNLMLEAQSMGIGRTRGTGNRLEYHWLSDNKEDNNQPTPPDNLGKVREGLGKGVPYAETTTNQGFEANLGKLGKGIPNSSLTHQTVDISEEESLLEGGSVPEASLTSLQDSSDVDTVGNTDLGNNLGKGFPNSSLTSLNDNQKEPAQPEEVEAIAIDPISKAEAWAQLTREEQLRIKVLKPKAVVYCKGDKVTTKENPQLLGKIERFDEDFGEYLIHFDHSSDCSSLKI